MALTCPRCSHENPDRSTFCVRCGNRMQTTGQIGQVPSQFNIPSSFSYSAVADPPPYTPPPQVPSYSPPPIAPSSALPTPPPVVESWATPVPAYSPPSSYGYGTQTGTGQGTASIRRAFAGHGILVMHHSWLLNGQQTQAKAAHEAITQKLQQHGTARLKITPERLMEQGLLMEERDYVKVSRGSTTVFAYVAPVGQDLYISRATTILPGISSFRIAFLCFYVFILLFGPSILSNIASSSVTANAPLGYLYGPVVANVVASLLSALTYPLWALLIWLLIRSIVYGLVENDFWRYLRRKDINDFQLDDIALMEHITDDVVHTAVQELGMDASKVTPPVEGYRPKRTVRSL